MDQVKIGKFISERRKKAGLTQMQLAEMTGVPVPSNLAGLREKEERHTDVIDKEAMLDYIMK